MFIGDIMYQNIINTLASDDYLSVKKDLYKLIHDKEFIKYIVQVHNPIVFDRFIKMCEYKIDTSFLYEERNKFIKKSLLNLNKDAIINFFGLNSIDKEHDAKVANRYLTEYIISYYFGDNYYNFMTNLYQIFGYLRSVNKDLIDSYNINVYKEFIDIKNASFEDKIGIFKLYLNDNLMEMFYDDINKVREDSHKMLVDESLKLNHNSIVYSDSMSKKIGLDIYKLDGEAFYGFVRCLSIPRGNLYNYYDYVNSEGNRLGYSFSYIGDKNIGTTDYDGNSVTLFYDKIDYKNIMYVHHADLHSKKMYHQDDYLSIKENEITTPRNLIAHTKNYNEIYIKSNGRRIVPTALVCYNIITEKDIEFAKKYNLSILLINKEKYKRYEEFLDDYNDYSYVI